MRHRDEIHALKCFLKDLPGREERHKRIEEYIKINNIIIGD
jgi:hypothetical protein